MPTSQEQQPSFGEVKASASKNIGQLLQDLQSFEHAIETENVAEIYRIYQGKLHKELKETSNQNHEIDNLLARKLHEIAWKKEQSRPDESSLNCSFSLIFSSKANLLFVISW